MKHARPKDIESLPAKKYIGKSTTRLVWHTIVAVVRGMAGKILRCKENFKLLYKLAHVGLNYKNLTPFGLNFSK